MPGDLDWQKGQAAAIQGQPFLSRVAFVAFLILASAPHSHSNIRTECAAVCSPHAPARPSFKTGQDSGAVDLEDSWLVSDIARIHKAFSKPFLTLHVGWCWVEAIAKVLSKSKCESQEQVVVGASTNPAEIMWLCSRSDINTSKRNFGPLGRRGGYSHQASRRRGLWLLRNGP